MSLIKRLEFVENVGRLYKFMSRLKQRYQEEIRPQLQSEFGIENVMATPKLSKIVINVGAGEAKDNSNLMERIVADMTALSGQKPVVTRAKVSISGFKLGKGQNIGAMVTLRGVRMYDFLDKLITIALPKVRDFRGMSATAFDNQGNYTLGLKEPSIFAEVAFQSGGAKLHGLEISIVNTAKDKMQGRKLLELLGFPFTKG